MFTLLLSQNLCRSSLPRSFTTRHRRQSLVLAIAAANESSPLPPKTVQTQNTKQTLVSWSARSFCALPSPPTTARWPQNRNRAVLLWMDVMDGCFSGSLDDLLWDPPGMSLISPVSLFADFVLGAFDNSHLWLVWMDGSVLMLSGMCFSPFYFIFHLLTWWIRHIWQHSKHGNTTQVNKSYYNF
jgi:hypothetical protein